MSVEISQTEIQIKNKGGGKKTENPRSNFEWSKMHVIKIPERWSKTVNGIKEKYEYIMAKNFPKLVMTSNHRSNKLREHQRE